MSLYDNKLTRNPNWLTEHTFDEFDADDIHAYLAKQGKSTVTETIQKNQLNNQTNNSKSTHDMNTGNQSKFSLDKQFRYIYRNYVS